LSKRENMARETLPESFWEVVNTITRWDNERGGKKVLS